VVALQKRLRNTVLPLQLRLRDRIARMWKDKAVTLAWWLWIVVLASIILHTLIVEYVLRQAT
jgi:hypothetical protein